jgi:hypothetical protein
MQTRVGRLLLCLISATLFFACDSDQLSQRPEPPPAPPAPPPPPPPPDAGIADMGMPEPVDAGVPDAGEEIPTASESVYINTGEMLYAYDPSTGNATRRGAFRSNQGDITGMVDIAIDLGGRMYGGTTERQIWRIDPETGWCTFLATYSDILHGLTFLSDGRLVVAGHSVTIVDPLTGRTIETLVEEGEYETSGDIIGLPDGYLYWSVRGGQGNPDDLVRIDPRTGTTRVLGNTGATAIYGLGFADNVLYGFLRDGVLVRLNQNNGQATSEGTLDGRWYGATTNPVLW